jgi:hypothetical protein
VGVRALHAFFSVEQIENSKITELFRYNTINY